MVTALPQSKDLTLATHQTAEAAGLLAWEKRRRWSRTNTARWLNDRSPAVLAWLRRRPGHWPDHSNQIGYWLQEYSPKIFVRIHARLSALPDDPARDAALPSTILR